MIIEIIGIDGSGKTSVAKYLANNLSNENFEFVSPFEKRNFIHEAEQIAKKENLTKYDVFSDKFINCLWIDDLLDNYIYTIKPLLDNGKNIIFDRYLYSAAVYSKLTTKENMDQYYQLLKKCFHPLIYIFILMFLLILH